MMRRVLPNRSSGDHFPFSVWKRTLTAASAQSTLSVGHADHHRDEPAIAVGRIPDEDDLPRPGCGQGHTLTPTAVAVLSAALLAWKEPMAWFSLGLTEIEIRSAILLAVLAFVVYPALPAGHVDPWGLLEPRAAWVTIILIASIGFANYVLLKLYGARGIELTGFVTRREPCEPREGPSRDASSPASTINVHSSHSGLARELHPLTAWR